MIKLNYKMRCIVQLLFLTCIVSVATQRTTKRTLEELESSSFSSSTISQKIVNKRSNDTDPSRYKSHRLISQLKCAEYSRTTVWILKNSEPIPIFLDCVATVTPLVTGGETARVEDFPHMAAVGWLQSNRSIGYFCGGTLVSDRWVLTAAHCTHHASLGKPSFVRLGTSRLSNVEAGKTLKIGIIKRHPRYRPPSMYADLALLKLSEQVSFTSTVRPACLDTDFHKLPKDAWATGWGSTDPEDYSTSDVLMKAKLKVIDNVSCAITHSLSKSVPSGVVPSMVCAGDPSGEWRKDTCRGDSGGPLQTYHPDKCLFSVMGITSFGRKCGTPGFPGVYTRVSHYVEWIESIVWPESHRDVVS